MPTIAQTLTRQLRSAHRRASRYEESDGWGYDYADFITPALDQFYDRSVRYLEYQEDQLAFLDGNEADLTLYPDGSVGVHIAAIPPEEGIFALTRKADLLAAKALLGPPPLPDCSLPPRSERHRAGSHCWVMISLGGRCQDCHPCDACGAPAVNHCSCGVHTCLACESKRNKERK